MNYQIVWTANALEGAREIVDGIAIVNKDAALRIASQLLRRIEDLSNHPRLGPMWRGSDDDSIRQLVVGTQLVIYRVVEERSAVELLAVRDGRRRPLTTKDL